MRVMCIDYFKDKTRLGYDCKHPEMGKVYTVINENETGYQLGEMPTNSIGLNLFYIKKKFAPVSEIDETEILEERQQQLQLTQK